MTCCTTVSAPSANASSTTDLSGNFLPPRICSSAVITTVAPTSTILSSRDFAENPPKTTEWVAPNLAQACMATMPSMDIAMYKTTRSPFLTPILFKPLAN